MKFFRPAFLLLGALTLCGCVNTKVPVGTTAGLGADRALIGDWHGTTFDGRLAVFAHVLPDKDGGLAAMVFERGKDETSAAVLTFRTATLGANRFATVMRVLDLDKEPKWTELQMPVLYRFGADGTLAVSLPDVEQFTGAVQKGLLAGQAVNNSYDIVITSDARQLDAFMARPEAVGLFKPYAKLRKSD